MVLVVVELSKLGEVGVVVVFVLIEEVVPGRRAFKCATRRSIWWWCWQYDLRSDGTFSQIFDFVGSRKGL